MNNSQKILSLIYDHALYLSNILSMILLTEIRVVDYSVYVHGVAIISQIYLNLVVQDSSFHIAVV